MSIKPMFYWHGDFVNLQVLPIQADNTYSMETWGPVASTLLMQLHLTLVIMPLDTLHLPHPAYTTDMGYPQQLMYHN